MDLVYKIDQMRDRSEENFSSRPRHERIKNRKMKLLVAALLVAAVTSFSSPSNKSLQPWVTGRQYKYRVQAHTLAWMKEGASSGAALKSQLVVQVVAPGRLQAKFEDTQHAQVHEHLRNPWAVPEKLHYQNVKDFDQHFEVTVDGGRVMSLKVPHSLNLEHENLLKGLFGALQMDLTPYRVQHSSHDFYDNELKQGQFRKMETDVTGDCETLYTVSPLAVDWRKELPHFTEHNLQPIEVTKSRDYNHCHHRVSYHFGVPHNTQWKSNVVGSRDEQFMQRSMTSRIIADKTGTIYKTQTTSEVHVSPLIYGKQKAQVLSFVDITLMDVRMENQQEWQMPENMRFVNSLLYSLTDKPQKMGRDSSSSSSSSSSESNEHQNNDEKFNYVRNRLNLKNLNKPDFSSSSSSSSSSSDSTYTNDEVPHIDQPAYAALYMSPQSANENKENTATVQKLVHEIAKDIQSSNTMPKSDPLMKFNIVVRLLAGMTTQQIKQVSRVMETTKSSNNLLKVDTWYIYRDAVVQAGTMPAFQQIKTWILSKKLQKEEAAQVIASMATTLRYPTKQLMTEFFKLAVSEEVKQQKHLHTAALLAATKFINMGQVNNETARDYYPSHMYGRLADKDDKFVVNDVIPHLRKELQNAIQQQDSNKAQIYIKALGQLGHPEIINVYSPYLEGKVQVSKYLRTLMVESFSTLAYNRDHKTQAVLYSILRNTAEAYEVRVAAAQNIFMTNPSPAMMNSMAQMTRKDPSVQVRSILKSTIISIAQMKSSRFMSLPRAAQAVQNMLTEEEFGVQYSNKKYMDQWNTEENYGSYRIVSSIGSEDNLWPKHLNYYWKNKLSGWMRPNWVSASTSSMTKLIKFFENWQQQKNQQQNQNQEEFNFKFSPEKIEQMLNLKNNQPLPLEINLFIDFLNQQRFFAFSESDLQQLPQMLQQYMNDLTKGIDCHYTKIVNQYQVAIMFPLAMGVPFVYKYKEPALIHVQSKSKANNQDQQTLFNINKEVELVYAQNMDGRVGFLNTLANNYASVGVVKKVQITIPIKADINIENKSIKVRLSPLRPDQDTTIVHYSVWPYSAQQGKDSNTPVSHDPNTQVISGKNKMSNIDFKFGTHSTGMQFQLNGYSYSPIYQNIGLLLNGQDWWTKVMSHKNQGASLTHFNLKYLGKQSQAKGVTIKAVYDNLHSQNSVSDSIQMTAEDNIEDLSPDSQNRRQQLLQKVSTGIAYAESKVIDLSATFDGEGNGEYIVTAALGQSRSDPTMQYAFVANRISKTGKCQVKGAGKVIKPDNALLNLNEALKQTMKSKFQMAVNFQHNSEKQSKLNVQGHLERTKEHTDIINKLSLENGCQKQMEGNNYFQPSCRRLIMQSYVPDQLKATILYKDMTPMLRNWAYQLSRYAQYLGFYYSQENIFRSNPEGKIELESNVSVQDKTFNMTILSKAGEWRIHNAPLRDCAIPLMSMYPAYSAVERVANVFTSQQYTPYCALDQSQIKTFSNRTYEYQLSKSWHVVMQSNNKIQYNGQNVNSEQITILARRPNQKDQDVYIAYRSQSGVPIEIQLRPNNEGSHAQRGHVQVNTLAKKTENGRVTVYSDPKTNKPLLYQSVENDGTILINIKGQLRVLYDGQRVVILSNSYKHHTQGICGQQTGDKRDDFMTPYGWVNSAEHYGASYSLNEEGDAKTQQLKEDAMKNAHEPKRQYTSILNSDSHWTEGLNSNNKNVFRVKSYSKKDNSECKIDPQIQYFESHGRICITSAMIPSCTSNCRGVNMQPQRSNVVCRPSNDQEFQKFKSQIHQGQNPQMSESPVGVQEERQFLVPSSCQQ